MFDATEPNDFQPIEPRQLWLPFETLPHRTPPPGFRPFHVEPEPDAAPASFAVPGQPELPIKWPLTQVTPLMRQVLRFLERCARTAAAVPANPALAEAIGGSGRQAIAKALKSLVERGQIRWEFRAEERRAIIVRTGAATDWGEYWPGHQPTRTRTTTPRTRVAAEEKPKPPAPTSRDAVGFGGGLRLLGTDERTIQRFERERRDYQRFEILDSCQFLDEQDGKAIRCTSPALPRKSWCAAHLLVIRR
jgi:hypothetical protein